MSHKRTRVSPSSSSSHAPTASSSMKCADASSLLYTEERPCARQKIEEEKGETGVAVASRLNDGIDADARMQDTRSENATPATSPLCSVCLSTSWSPFTRVMSGLCLVQMLHYISIRDRLDQQRVSKLWRRTLELPSLWIDYEFHDLGSKPDDTRWYSNALSKWMMQRVIRLRITATRLCNVNLNFGFERFAHIKHLTVINAHGLDLPFGLSYRNSLIALKKLESLTIEGEEDKTDFMDSLVGETKSKLEPALFTWCDTLCELKILGTASVLKCLAHRTWTKLARLTLIDVSALQSDVEAPVCHFLNSQTQHLPALEFLKIDIGCQPSFVEHFEALLRELPLRQLKATIRVTQLTIGPFDLDPTSEIISIRPVQSLSSHAEDFILLTRFESLVDWKHQWQCIGTMHQMRILDMMNLTDLPITALEVFEAIGGEWMPHLHTLSIMHQYSLIQDTLGNTRIRELMRSMTSLTSLSVRDYFIDQSTFDNSFRWMDHLHTLPSLTFLRLGMYRKIPSVDPHDLQWGFQDFSPLWPELQRAVVCSRRLREFQLPPITKDETNADCPQYERSLRSSQMPIMAPLIEAWRRRAEKHFVQLEKLTLVSLHGDEVLSETIRDLATLPQLTSLSIHVMRGPDRGSLPRWSYQESNFPPVTPDAVYYYQLVKLRHLRHLKIVDAYNKMSNDLIHFWCSPLYHHFLQLQSLRMSKCDGFGCLSGQEEAKEEEEEWYHLTDLPLLSFIEAPDSDLVDDVEFVNFYRTPFLRLTCSGGKVKSEENTHLVARCFVRRKKENENPLLVDEKDDEDSEGDSDDE